MACVSINTDLSSTSWLEDDYRGDNTCMLLRFALLSSQNLDDNLRWMKSTADFKYINDKESLKPIVK